MVRDVQLVLLQDAAERLARVVGADAPHHQLLQAGLSVVGRLLSSGVMTSEELCAAAAQGERRI